MRKDLVLKTSMAFIKTHNCPAISYFFTDSSLCFTKLIKAIWANTISFIRIIVAFKTPRVSAWVETRNKYWRFADRASQYIYLSN